MSKTSGQKIIQQILASQVSLGEKTFCELEVGFVLSINYKRMQYSALRVDSEWPNYILLLTITLFTPVFLFFFLPIISAIHVELELPVSPQFGFLILISVWDAYFTPSPPPTDFQRTSQLLPIVI